MRIVSSSSTTAMRSINGMFLLFACLSFFLLAISNIAVVNGSSAIHPDLPEEYNSKYYNSTQFLNVRLYSLISIDDLIKYNLMILACTAFVVSIVIKFIKKVNHKSTALVTSKKKN